MPFCILCTFGMINVFWCKYFCAFTLVKINLIVSKYFYSVVLLLVLTSEYNPLLAGLPASATKQLQCIRWLVFNLLKFSHVTPLLCDLHRLPVAARVRFKMMVLVFKAVNGTAPSYVQTLVRPCKCKLQEGLKV